MYKHTFFTKLILIGNPLNNRCTKYQHHTIYCITYFILLEKLQHCVFIHVKIMFRGPKTSIALLKKFKFFALHVLGPIRYRKA